MVGTRQPDTRILLLAALAALCACAPSAARLEFDVDAPAVADPEALLRMATSRDQAVRRRASADLAIFLMKKNGVWRENVDPFDWKIPDERGIRMNMAALRSDKQKPEYALANLCAHCMGMIPGRAWHVNPVSVEDEFEGRVCRVAVGSPDPAVRVVLLVGLASSKTFAARRTIVAATADLELGVRKSAVYLIDHASGGASGPCGAIHIGSTAADVDYAGKSIRESFAKGWTGRTYQPGQTGIIGDD